MSFRTVAIADHIRRKMIRQALDITFQSLLWAMLRVRDQGQPLASAIAVRDGLLQQARAYALDANSMATEGVKKTVRLDPGLVQMARL